MTVETIWMGMMVAEIVLSGVLHTINNLDFPFSSYLFITEYFSIRLSGWGVPGGRYPCTIPHTYYEFPFSIIFNLVFKLKSDNLFA